MDHSAISRTGKCICGAVKFTASLTGDLSACHCQQCQRWSGGGPLVVAAVKELEISGEDSIAAYHASEWGERGFCGTCGCNIYWRMQGQAPNSIAAGLLDDQSGLRIVQEIFIDHRPNWAQPYAGAEQSTEAQEMAKLAAFQAQGGGS